MARSPVDDALVRADALVGEVTDRLGDLVRIPSVSAEGFPAGEVRRSAEATAALLREAGRRQELQHAKLHLRFFPV